jgi:hypothetical protein
MLMVIMIVDQAEVNGIYGNQVATQNRGPPSNATPRNIERTTTELGQTINT